MKVPLAGDTRLLEAEKYHPAYTFRPSDGVLHIPIAIVEYNKANQFTHYPAGVHAHADHLRYAITAVLPLYDALGISTPLIGLLFDQYTVKSRLGMTCIEDEVTMVSLFYSFLWIMYRLY